MDPANCFAIFEALLSFNTLLASEAMCNSPLKSQTELQK
jgi:hypothetical protein